MIRQIALMAPLSFAFLLPISASASQAWTLVEPGSSCHLNNRSPGASISVSYGEDLEVTAMVAGSHFSSENFYISLNGDFGYSLSEPGEGFTSFQPNVSHLILEYEESDMQELVIGMLQETTLLSLRASDHPYDIARWSGENSEEAFHLFRECMERIKSQ